MTKVAYKWTDNQSRLRVDRKLCSPTSERSKVKLSPRWKDNDQSHLRVDRKPKLPTMAVQSIDLPTYRVTNDPSDPPKIIDSNRNH